MRFRRADYLARFAIIFTMGDSFVALGVCDLVILQRYL